MSFNINDLTIGQAKEIAGFLGAQEQVKKDSSHDGIRFAIGKMVIIRTYSAGVWFGELEQKSGNEVILKDARRMYKWWAAQSISLSAVAIHGIKREESKICEAVCSVWLEAIEILPCTDVAIDSIGGAKIVKAQ